jgi:hypothetical protein
MLLLNTPVEYLYSFTYSKKKTVRIQPFSKEVKKTGNVIRSKIQQTFPELNVHLIGSAELGIAGQRDVDLLIECPWKEFSKYKKSLELFFGPADKVRKKFIEWHFLKNNCSVEILLVDPTSRVFRGPVNTFAVLKSNPKYIEKYEEIKKVSNGSTIREYKRRRLAFFNAIMNSNNKNSFKKLRYV